MKMVYLNETGRSIHIYKGTELVGVKCDMSIIKPNEKREFVLPDNTYPVVQTWDCGGKDGLILFVSYAEEGS